jgi:hypothetical protein
MHAAHVVLIFCESCFSAPNNINFLTLDNSYMPGYVATRTQVSALYHLPEQKPQRDRHAGMLVAFVSFSEKPDFATEDVIFAAPSGCGGIACPPATATSSGIEFDWGYQRCECAGDGIDVLYEQKFLHRAAMPFRNKGGTTNASANNITLNGASGFDACFSSVRG